MKKTKRVLSMLLAVVLLFGIVSVSASAASTKWGYMVPTNSKFTKQASTVALYGRYDYINFYIDCNSNNTYYFYEIFSDSKYTNLVAYDAVVCNKGEYEFSSQLDLKSFKTGTYYGVCYAGKIYSNGTYSLDENSLVSFKVKVNRTTAFDKQMVIVKSATASVNGPVIKWSKLSGATKYIVYRRAATGTKWTKLATTTSTSYTDKSVAAKSGSYVYTVKAVNKKNVASRYLYAGVAIDFVGAPKINSVKVSGNNCTVSWSKISGVKTYYVYRKVDGGSWSRIGTVTNGATSFVDKKSKTSGTKYIYTVKAVRVFDGVNVAGKYNAGKSVVFVTAPTVSSISTTSDNVTVVKWNTVKNSTYVVYRKVEGGSWTVLAKGYKGTSFKDTTAKKDGTNYIYTVRATQKTSYGNVQGHYVASKAFAFTTMPKNIVATSGETGVKLTWDSVASAKSYTVYSKNIDGTGSWVNLGKATSNEFVDTASGVNGARIYTVRSEGSSVRGSYSSSGVVYFNPDAPVLTIDGEDGNYTISWEAVAGADSYAVYRKAEGGEWTLLGTTAELSYADALTEEGVYSYSVTALRGDISGVFNDIGYSVDYSVETVDPVEPVEPEQ